MTGCHQNTLTLRGLVNWAFVALELLELRSLARSEKHHWASHEENLRITLIEGLHFWVPLGSLKEHSHDIDSIVWSFSVFLVGDDLVIEAEKIDGDTVLSGVVLLSTSQESLGEEESSDPKDLWESILSPLFEPLESGQQILHVSSQSLERWEGDS